MSRQIYAVCLKCLFSLVLLLSLAMPALAQSSSSAAVNGTVQDTTDARIPNATVKLVSTTTGLESHTTTSKDGNFTLPIVKPGQYTLQIERDGFDTTQLTGIVLNVGDNRSVVIHMKVGSKNETVTVDGSGLTLNTTDATVGTVIDRKFVENTPLNGRSFQDLISMTPGVTTQSPQSAQSTGGNGDFSVNGQRTESNYYTVDGVSANANAGAGSGIAQPAVGGTVSSSTALGTTQSLISIDALQEFRVESSSYSAAYGRNPGAQFVLATRSGTGTFHGDVFEYLRNDLFDANNWFNDYYDKPKSALRQSDFGGTLGGPIWIPRIATDRQKTFFFGSYEGLRLSQPQPSTLQYVPDPNLRKSAALQLQGILNAFPLPNGQEVTIPCTNGPASTFPCPIGIPVGTPIPSGLAQFIESYSLPASIDSTSIRVDRTLGTQTSLFFRFGYTPSFASSRTLSSFTKKHNDTQNYTLGADSQISTRLSNSFRLGYTRSQANYVASLDNFGGATPISLAQSTGVGDYPNAEPNVILYFAGIGTSSLNAGTSLNRGRQWNLTDTVKWQSRGHLMSFGVDYRRILSPLTPGSPEVIGEFQSPSSMLENAATYAEVVNEAGAAPIFNETALFAQDEWTAAPNLHVSLGLRWELAPPPGAEDGRVPYTLSGSIGDPSSLALAPQGTPLWKTTWYNFAPRLGVAWIAHSEPGRETVLRAGGGVFFDNANELAADGYFGVGFTAYNLYYGGSLPLTHDQVSFSPSTNPPYTSSEIYAFPSHLQLPYTLEWNVSLEQALSKESSLTLSYVGSNGRRLLQEQELNIASHNPDFGTIFYIPNGVSSNYQALQAKLRRSVAKGLQALASYTWAHSIDFGSNDSALPLTRGNSDFDVRSNFQGGLSWQLPETRRSIIGPLVNHWGVDMRFMSRTAFPVTLDGNKVVDPATGSEYYTGVNLIPSQPVFLRSANYPGGRAINPRAFQIPEGIASGDAPRNFVRGFGATQANLAVRRFFPLTDRAGLQFRAESFDLTNHPNFGYVDPYLTDATFGQATKTLDQSLATVAAQYQQGGARSLQFALKLTF